MVVKSHQPKMDSGRFIVQDIHLEDVVDDVPPPPSHLTSKFKTLQDWLFNICDSKELRKSIQQYSFGLFESPDEKVLFLVGQNTYTKENSSHVRTEFMPSNMYFLLSKSEYDSLTQPQIADKLFPVLKEFTDTEKFKTSFLAKANSIKLVFKGVIWSK
jgi:hypothetical protein